MSTFNGKIEEIPEISVDRFNNENIYSTAYFLSHCHTDHMIGLEDWNFQTNLSQRPNVFLYASSISLKILKYKFPTIHSNLKELPIDTPTLIKLNDSERTLSVTALPAGHCPGSVMLLFESDNLTVLYTGDYRVKVEDLKKFNAFYSLGQIKKIKKMYLDTTFFKKSLIHLPSRQEATQIICKYIQDWISQSKMHIIQLHISAKYGPEYLFSEISKSIGSCIHVGREVYNTYKCIPELNEYVTLNGENTQIHASCGFSYNEICRPKDIVKIIKPSAFWWQGKDLTSEIAVEDRNIFRVCYSCHASFEEITDFLMFLKPSEIEPCVVPNSPKDKEELRTNLDFIMSCYKQQENLINIQKDEIDKVGINILRCVTPESLPDTLNNILDSPPKVFKRKRLWLGEDEEIKHAPF